jgi:cardiolipin synthase
MWTIPNLISMLRILMTPFVLVELSRGRFLIGGWLFGAAAFTDILDGAFARGAGAESKLGLYLDPIADKILLSTTYIGLAIGGAVPVWLVVLIFARDLWILLLSWIALQFTKFRNLSPSIWGKASTFIQVITVAAVTAARAYGVSFFWQAGRALIWAVAALAALSAVDYSMRGIVWLRQMERTAGATK